MQFINRLYKISFFVAVFFFLVSAADSTSVSTSTPVSSPTSVNDIILFVTFFSSVVTILAIVFQSIKFKSRPQKPTDIDQLKQNLKETTTKVDSLTEANLNEKIKTIQGNIQTIDKVINDLVKIKINSLSETVTKLDQKLSDLNKYFETALSDRKEENKQIKQEINTLRENIREDINDVKSIIMKLMFVLKNDDT